MTGHATDSSLLSSSAVIFARMSRIGELSQQIAEHRGSPDQLARNVKNYYRSIEYFRILCLPHLMEEDETAIDALKRRYNELYIALETPRGKAGISRNEALGMEFTIQLSNEIMEVLIRRLGRSGLYAVGSMESQGPDGYPDGQIDEHGNPEEGGDDYAEF